MGEFVKAGKKEEISAGQGKAVEVGGKTIAVFNVDGAYYAVADTCTHQGASLSGGTVDGNVVTCPWHAARFDLKTGEAVGPPASNPVTCYLVRAAGDDIEIEV